MIRRTTRRVGGCRRLAGSKDQDTRRHRRSNADVMRFLIPVMILSTALFAGAQAEGARERQALPVIKSGLRRDALACYALFDSAGRTLVGQLTGAPRMVRLDSTVVHRWGGASSGVWRLVQPLGQEEEYQAQAIQNGMLPVWAADSLTDTVRFSFSTGYTGSSFAFNLPAIRGFGALEGRGHSFTDVLVMGDELAYDRIKVIRHDCRRFVAPSR